MEEERRRGGERRERKAGDQFTARVSLLSLMLSEGFPSGRQSIARIVYRKLG